MKEIGSWIAIGFVLLCMGGGFMRILDWCRDTWRAFWDQPEDECEHVCLRKGIENSVWCQDCWRTWKVEERPRVKQAS